MPGLTTGQHTTLTLWSDLERRAKSRNPLLYKQVSGTLEPKSEETTAVRRRLRMKGGAGGRPTRRPITHQHDSVWQFLQQ